MHRPQVKLTRLFLFPALAATLAACDGVTDPGVLAPGSVAASVQAEADAAAETQRLARAFAVALKRPEIRAQLRSAMRESRWSEEKLVLQEFARTRAGEALVAAAAEALGTTPATLQSTIAALPALDFYLPFQGQRQAWRGSPDVLVSSTFDGDAPAIQAYATDGSARTLLLADGVPAQPLVLLQPAEPKRVVDGGSKQPGGPLMVIEPTCDETTAFQSCEGGSGGGGTGGTSTPPPPPAPGVYITHFNIQEGDGWFGSLEMQFHSQAVNGVYPPNSALNPYPIWIFDQYCSKGSHYPSFSPNEDQGYSGLWMLSPGVTNVNGVSCGFYSGTAWHYSIQIIEVDGGLNGNNDDFGRRFYPADGAQVGQTIEFRRSSDGARTAWLKIEYRY